MKREITRKILGAAYRVHSKLGPGLLERTYELCLCHELQQDGLYVEEQKPMPLVYEGVRLETGYRMDIVVNGSVVIEVKSIECFNDVHTAQVLTYLKLSGLRVGLIINFNVAHLRQGIKRLIL